MKRIKLEDVEHIRPSGLIIMNLKDDDELVSVKLANGSDDIIFVSEQGMGIRFSVDDLPTRRRAAGGVKGMSLRTGDKVVSMDVGNDSSRLLIISRMGRGKVNPLSEYRRQGRGGLGLKTFKLTKNTGLIADAEIVAEATEVYVVSEKAQIMRTNLSEISNLRGRITQGVTIFKPRDGDSVSSIACVGDLEWPDEPKIELNGSVKTDASKGKNHKNKNK